VYNGEPFLAETLKSISAQTYGDLEILVSDNASTDGTPEIVAAAMAADPRIRYERQEVNRGGVWNWNHLVDEAGGEFFKFAAADDVMRPGFIAACVELLERGGRDVVLAYPRTQIIDERGTITQDLDDGQLHGDRPTPHARLNEFLRAQAAHLVYGVYRTDVLRSTRRLLPVVGNDVVLLAEMACRGRFALAGEQLFLQRRHSRQFSAQGARQAHFHAPGRAVRFAFPQTRTSVELWRAVLTSPLGPTEKVRCLVATSTSWTIPRWRGPAGDLRRAITGR
jgi:glycosyltransferase involved in cell wall biosynthesis